jgi:hypothetical protein
MDTLEDPDDVEDPFYRAKIRHMAQQELIGARKGGAPGF